MSVPCECCVLCSRGLCDALITCPEESYQLRCVVVCDLETSRMRSWHVLNCRATRKKMLSLFFDVHWFHKFIRFAHSNFTVLATSVTSITASV
jgi:hypothetical protein